MNAPDFSIRIDPAAREAQERAEHRIAETERMIAERVQRYERKLEEAGVKVQVWEKIS